MKFLRVVVPLVILTLVVACNPLKHMQTLQSSVLNAYESGNYDETMTSYDLLEKYQSTKGEVPGMVYLKMAVKAANELKRFGREEELLGQWLERSKDEEAILMMGKLLYNSHQPQKEKAHWEKYLPMVKSDEVRLEILSRQFTMEVKNENYKEALELWEKMPPTSLPELVFLRAKALKATGKEKEADALVEKILVSHPDYEPALLWKGIKIYKKADKWYQSEMGKYNKKPDYTSYVYLRRELKKISTLYRQSKVVFEKLRKADPENKTYIRYLKNIYLRLEMKAEAIKMDMLLNHQK